MGAAPAPAKAQQVYLPGLGGRGLRLAGHGAGGGTDASMCSGRRWSSPPMTPRGDPTGEAGSCETLPGRCLRDVSNGESAVCHHHNLRSQGFTAASQTLDRQTAGERKLRRGRKMNDAVEDPERSTFSRRQFVRYAGVGATFAAASTVLGDGTAAAHDDDDDSPHPGHDGSRNRAWRARDHHVHSECSGEFDTSTNPPTFLKGADAVYPIVTNAIMAKYLGLTWAMCTDHGGPTHSKVNLEQAYPDLLRSRELVPDVLKFWGMEFDAPALDHHTLMIPRARCRGRAAVRAGEPLREERRLPVRPEPRHRSQVDRVPQGCQGYTARARW